MSKRNDGISGRSRAVFWGTEPFVDLGFLPDTVPRRCTDSGWAVLFVLCLLAWVLCGWQAIRAGDVEKLQDFENGHGMRCKLDGPTPFLFFCRNKTGGLHDLVNPICRSECPRTADSSHPECGAAVDYHSLPILGMVCIPEGKTGDVKEDTQLWAYRKTAELSVMMRIIVQRWRSLLACAVIAVFASYIEIYILENNAGCLLRFGIVTLGFGCLLTAGILANWFQRLGIGVDPSPYNTGASFVLCLLGVIFVMILCFSRDSIDTASDCIELACRCVLQTRSLSVHPLVNTIYHQANNIFSFYTIVLILSTGHEGLMSGPGILSDLIGWQLDLLHELMLTLVICMWMWIHQVIFAVSEFGAAYATVIWYFADDDGTRRFQLKKFTLLRATWAACRYHLGTLSLGGLVISWSRVLRLPLGFLVGWMYLDNPLSRCCHQILCGCTWLWENTKPLHKNAFIDVAMNARPFFEAAHQAESLADRERDAYRILSGATSLFQAVGVCANAAFGACTMTFISVVLIDDDPGVTVTMVCAGAACAASTALPFALIFDTVSDTILYCSGVEDARRDFGKVGTKTNGSTMVARVCPCIFKPTLRAGQSRGGEADGLLGTFGMSGAMYPGSIELGEKWEEDFELRSQEPVWQQSAQAYSLHDGKGKGQGKGGLGSGKGAYLKGQPF